MKHDETQHAARTGSALHDRLQTTVDGLGGAEEQRREPLVERAEARGLDRVRAEQAYDLAREENLMPAYGLALVVESVSVQVIDGPRPDVETSEPNEPEWVDAPPDPARALEERRLRQTFRRLRSHLESCETAEDALAAFAAEEDLERYEY